MRAPRVVVVGGGLTGLAAAWRLRNDAEVVLLEASPRLGGAVRTVDLDGVAFDVGADAFLARQPHAQRLVHEVGLGDSLVAPSGSRVMLARGGRLRRLPEQTLMGAPGSVLALARSGALSPTGVLRAALEPIVGRRQTGDDLSVSDLLTPRFGRELVEQVVEPLLGGVYAGRADQLSARATAPPLFALAECRSMLLALATRRSAGADGPVFLTLRGGLGTLVRRLADDLADVRTSTPATSIRRDGSRLRVGVGGGHLDADHVIVATPAESSARLVHELAPEAAALLDQMRSASVAVVALAYDTAQRPRASGMLVPRCERRMLKAATFSSYKWPHHAGHPRTLLRASVGRIDDDRHRALDDDELIAVVDRDLRELTGLRGSIVDSFVARWDRALPQYEVGHLERVAAIRAAIYAVEGLHVGGATFDGIGLAARCADGEWLAEAVLRDA